MAHTPAKTIKIENVFVVSRVRLNEKENISLVLKSAYEITERTAHLHCGDSTKPILWPEEILFSF